MVNKISMATASQMPRPSMATPDTPLLRGRVNVNLRRICFN